MTRSLAVLLVSLAFGPPLVAQPAYPHAVPDWYARLDSALDKPVTVDSAGRTIAQAVAVLEAQLGVAVRIDAPKFDAQRPMFELEPPTVSGRRVLLMLAVYELHTCLTEAGVVLCDDPSRYPQPANAVMWKLAEDIAHRASRPPGPSPLERVLQQRVTVDVNDATLEQVLAILAQQTDSQVVPVCPDLVGTELPKTSWSERDQTVERVLDALCARLDVGWYSSLDLLWVASKAQANAMRKRQAEQERERADRKARVIPSELAEVPIHELQPRLAATGTAILFTCAEAWKRPCLGVSTQGKTMAQLDADLRAHGLALVFEDVGTYLVALRPVRPVPAVK